MPGFEVIGEEELSEVRDVLEKSRVLFRYGFHEQRKGVFKVNEFEAAFSSRMGVAHSLAVTSGTAALRVALAALGIAPGDEVITQCFTFVATVEAIVEAGAKPICTEINETLNMCPLSLKKCITPRTKAIIAVHMLGVPADLDAISAIANEHGIPLIEDTAWGCGGRYRNRHLGTIGTMGTFSFDFAKTITTGEGGMVITNDAKLDSRARAWHDHGHHNNPSLPRWEDSRDGSGFNYRMSELQGAIGIAQLKKLDNVIARQRENAESIREALKGLPIEFRHMPKDSYCTDDAVMFFVRDSKMARKCREHLVSHGFNTKILPEAYSWHFAGTWSHIPSLMVSHNIDPGSSNLNSAFPRSKQLLERTVSLPISLMLSKDYPIRVRDVLSSALEEDGQ